MIPVIAGCLAVALAPALHLPHDDTHDLAVAPIAGGGVELLACTNSFLKVQRSLDGGLTWQPVAGEGLGKTQPLQVEYWPDPIRPRFFIGTLDGVWSYEPGAGTALRASVGLPDDARIVGLAASRSGDGAPFAVTTTGDVYRWREALSSWELALSTGFEDTRAKVAVTPHFDSLAGAGRERTVLAGIAGQLHVSTDGGDTWSVHTQFATAATVASDWWISALALAEDYVASGEVVVGRGREDLGAASGTAGELWRSDDAAGTFTLVLTTSSAVRSALATEPGPSGDRAFLATVEEVTALAAGSGWTGVLRSVDGGLSWSDHGNAQDFLMEPDASDSVGEAADGLHALVASPDYGLTGELFLGREEGFYRSADEGVSWRQRQIRSPAHVRALSLVADAGGALQLFAGTYGGGTFQYDVASGAPNALAPTRTIYVQDLAASPSFERDGAVLVGGFENLGWWFDPAKAGNNVFGWSGWLRFPEVPDGYCRVVAVHPEFDASPGALASQTIFWGNSVGSPSEVTYRSVDAGRTRRMVDTLFGGGEAPMMRGIEISPYYDAAQPAVVPRVFAHRLKQIYTLKDFEWAAVQTLPDHILDIELVPARNESEQPRLLVAAARWPYLFELTLTPTGDVVRPIVATGLRGAVQDLELSPAYRDDATVFVTTWGEGVFRLEVDAQPAQWELVGGAPPEAFAGPLAISPDFANDRRLLIGTGAGVYESFDQAGAQWTLLSKISRIDNDSSSVTTYSPAHPNNPDPARPWRWRNVSAEVVESVSPVFEVHGWDVSLAQLDGSRFEWEGVARGIDVRTVRGPGIGTLELVVEDLATGVVLASVTTDLDGPLPENALVSVDLAQETAVRVVGTAHLDAGEEWLFDGLELRD